MQQLRGKTAVVTGGASGIGNAIARAFAGEGMAVVLADIDAEALDSAGAELEARCSDVATVQVDVSDPASVEHLAAQAYERFGAVHVLVNNAGVVMSGFSWELTLQDWSWLHGVCFWGIVHGIRSFVPRMLASGEPGHVINVASMAGLAGRPRSAPYDSAKAAVVALTEDLAFELTEVGSQLRATVLCPGYTSTNISRSAEHRPDRYGAPPEERSAVVPSGRADLYATPDALAALAVEALRSGQLYALADWPLWRPVVERRFSAILEECEPSPPVYP